MRVQLEVEAPSDVERVTKAFGKKLNLDRPATLGEIEQDLAKYVQQTTLTQEQQTLYNVANNAAQQIQPVSIDVPDATPAREPK